MLLDTLLNTLPSPVLEPPEQRKFAISGGRPAFDTPLHVGRPNVGDRVRLSARFDDLLDRRWLTNGGIYVDEFERRVAALLAVKHAVSVCNATVGLEIAIRALGLSGEVIVPSFTFVATAHALEWMGITPVFCDIDPATHNLDPARVEALITPRTTGIIGVHVWGRPCAVEALTGIAHRHGLHLLFDAAHAFACTHRGRSLGAFGDAEVFSFHATKFVNAGEGGVVTTNDDALAERLRLMRNFGFVDNDRVVSVGTNGKMSEFSAAMGVTSLESLPEFVEANRVNHDAYAFGLDALPGVQLLRYDDDERNNHQYVVAEIDADVSGLTRDQLHAVLRAENVLARRYFYPACHRMEPYRTRSPDAGRALRHTEQVSDRVLCLPTGTAVGPAEIATICSIIRGALAAAPRLRALLADR